MIDILIHNAAIALILGWIFGRIFSAAAWVLERIPELVPAYLFALACIVGLVLVFGP